MSGLSSLVLVVFLKKRTQGSQLSYSSCIVCSSASDVCIQVHLNVYAIFTVNLTTLQYYTYTAYTCIQYIHVCSSYTLCLPNVYSTCLLSIFISSTCMHKLTITTDIQVLKVCATT